MGSVLLVVGVAVFLVCAVQVYVHKFLKKGAALRGLYSVLRHPQYLGLGVAGLGLAILWPRFLVAVLWLVMLLLYYLLAKDEERRMLGRLSRHVCAVHGEDRYGSCPRRVERWVLPGSVAGRGAAFVLIAVLVLGGAFALRGYTVRHLALWADANVVAVAVNPDDAAMMDHRLPDVLRLPEVRARTTEGKRYLVYFLPANYIMQGLIADTGGEWRLYKQHHTISMITDWIVNPFGHLTEGHAMHSASGAAAHPMTGGMERRLVFVEVSGTAGQRPFDVFGIGVERSPQFMLDVDIHTLAIRNLKDLPRETAWAQRADASLLTACSSQ